MFTEDHHVMSCRENTGYSKTYLVIGNTDNRNGIRINPDIILCEIHALVLKVLATVAELLPLLLPLGEGIVQGTRKVGIFTLIGMDCLLCTFEFGSDAFEILALDKGTLGRVCVDAKTILLVFLAGLVDVSFLSLFRLELLLDCSLIALTMLGLASNKGRDGIFEFISNLLRKLDVEGGLLFCLLSQCID
jgi:hypothetical protein